ncbi:cytochrome P450 [Hoeflea poritis]|uniref:Cytochrome P450 n=1 Tax=Hoeflea poritis TaxID=2993659 RepID=A0ABT4VNT0_9HYPH|nr:cytochrome P450 [Hoeflea poritis]MDA4846346.1 cytochrome P450 [Hoeflea poritis]
MAPGDGGRRLFGPGMLEDPFPVYARLRETEPVHFDKSVNAWILTRYADVSAVMKDRRFSSDRVTKARLRYSDKYEPVFDLLSRVMLQTDDPMHKRLRDLVHGAFTRTVVETYDGKIRALCDTLLAPGLERGEMEFVSEFAAPLPILVISEIVGIPAEEREQIKIWCDAFSTVALNFYTHLSDEQLDHCSVLIAEFTDYLKDKMAAARRKPGPDLISSLVVAADREHALDDGELIANCMFLLNAGNETTTCLLANGLGLLLGAPDQMAALRADPSLIPNAVEEFLRLQGPVQFIGRIATQDVTLGEQRVKEGEMVLPVLAAANRDPAVFERPDMLDVARDHIHQLSFGTGPHLCAGIQLARFEAKIAFERLFECTGHIELKGHGLEHTSNFNMRCLKELHVGIR